MKNLTLSAIVLICFLGAPALIAQTNCLDVVHPTDYRVSISSCCIKDIKEGNIVVYTQKGLTYETEAIAINMDGGYYELNTENVSTLRNLILQRDPDWKYLGNEYEYQQMAFNTAKTKLILGSALIPLGIGMTAAGASIMNKKAEEWPDTNSDGSGILIFLSGCAAIGVGIPLVIVGASKKHRAKKAMKDIKNSKTLSITAGSNGLTLVYNF